jgi:uncharacterized protein
MARVVHFEIPVDDPTRAQRFYQQLFGWDIAGYGDEGYWLATTGGDGDLGIDGALISRGEIHASPVLVIGVESLDDTVAQAEAAGAEILQGKHPIPTIGYSAYLRDPEGNVVGIFQPDDSAA